jgi:PEP-CTERM motif
MKKRSFFLAIAAGLLILGVATVDAQAGYVPLPTTLDALLPSRSDTSVAGAETLTFSAFTYSASAVPVGTPVPAASSLNVVPFTSGNETGFGLTGTLSATAGTMVDLSISYIVTAPAGQLINDAFLLTAGGALSGGNGSYLVSETLVNAVTLMPLVPPTTLSASPGAPTDLVSFAGVSSIFVTKDIFLTGGTGGVSLSVIDQGFSSLSVPEPTSMSLLGIGMTGFLVFRRFFKRTKVV